MRLIDSILLMTGLGFVSVTGCGSNTQTAAPQGPAPEAVAESELDHSGWWCVEHGVPEGECALCDTSLVADFKAKGDWCDEHNRPESQCYQCDPARLDRFAARYEAKFGERPPAPTQ
jgi:hypothetical protein